MKKTLSQHVREQLLEYGVNRSELPGLISTIVGNLPDETLNQLMCKNIRELSGLTVEELKGFPGMGKNKASRLVAAFELSRRLARFISAEKTIIRDPRDAASLVMEEMRCFNREHFCSIMLDTKNQVIDVDKVSIGTLSSSQVHPRELFRNAIKKSASRMILVHNHPSGDPEPSREDIEITKKVSDAGCLIGIEVLDHIVIGDGKYVSFKEKGLI
ncbi:RadC family protein [Pelotomaculum propionicicum]|uniref:RadC family protein n=1 Tax=Pelotomaculum propionicicum TaxID=258475 RepID=UPI003B7814EA